MWLKQENDIPTTAELRDENTQPNKRDLDPENSPEPEKESKST